MRPRRPVKARPAPARTRRPFPRPRPSVSSIQHGLHVVRTGIADALDMVELALNLAHLAVDRRWSAPDCSRIPGSFISSFSSASSSLQMGELAARRQPWPRCRAVGQGPVSSVPDQSYRHFLTGRRAPLTAAFHGHGPGLFARTAAVLVFFAAAAGAGLVATGRAGHAPCWWARRPSWPDRWCSPHPADRPWRLVQIDGLRRRSGRRCTRALVKAAHGFLPDQVHHVVEHVVALPAGTPAPGSRWP